MFENDMCSHLVLVHDIEHSNSGWVPTVVFMNWLDTISKSVKVSNKEED